MTRTFPFFTLFFIRFKNESLTVIAVFNDFDEQIEVNGNHSCVIKEHGPEKLESWLIFHEFWPNYFDEQQIRDHKSENPFGTAIHERIPLRSGICFIYPILMKIVRITFVERPLLLL